MDLPHVIKLERIGPYRLKLWFSDGRAGEWDFSELATRETGPMVEPFRDPDYFDRVFVEFSRTRCLKQRAKQLPPLCQSQLRERFVKWKEDRSRLKAACDEDVKQFCRAVKPGAGQILQCLQSHGQEVSDRCYQALPKGTVFFK